MYSAVYTYAKKKKKKKKKKFICYEQ